MRPALDGYRRWRFVPDGPLPCPVTIAWASATGCCCHARPSARGAPCRARGTSTLRGCGHVPTWDDPEQVARVLLEGSSG